MIKILSKLGLEADFFSLIKGIYEKHTANKNLNGEQTFSQNKYKYNIIYHKHILIEFLEMGKSFK